LFDHSPYAIQIDIKVEMDKDIPHSIYLFPGYFWMEIPEVLRNSTCSFTNNLKVVDDPGLH